MDITAAKLIVLQARVLKCHAEITSGAYKQRRDSSVENGWRESTDEEKLKDSMSELKAHIEFMADIQEHLENAVSAE